MENHGSARRLSTFLSSLTQFGKFDQTKKELAPPLGRGLQTIKKNRSFGLVRGGLPGRMPALLMYSYAEPRFKRKRHPLNEGRRKLTDIGKHDPGRNNKLLSFQTCSCPNEQLNRFLEDLGNIYLKNQTIFMMAFSW